MTVQIVNADSRRIAAIWAACYEIDKVSVCSEFPRSGSECATSKPQRLHVILVMCAKCVLNHNRITRYRDKQGA